MPPAVALGIGMIGMAAATIYTARQESKSAKKAAEAQQAVGLAQIQAPIDAEKAAAEAAKAKLKLKQASKSQTILSGPMESVNANMPSILGV